MSDLRELARMSSLFGGETFHFETVGDYVVGKVLAEGVASGDYGECIVLTIRATAARSEGIALREGSTVRIYCSSAYLREFAEENSPLLFDYIVLTLTDLRPSRRAGFSPTKVIEGAVKRRADVEEF